MLGSNTRGRTFHCSIIEEHGYLAALFGLGKSYGLTSGLSYQDFLRNVALQKRLGIVAKDLAPKMYGHNKFLESIVVWMDIGAPRYWWQEFAEYRIGRSTQSESTMHTLKDEHLSHRNFSSFADPMLLDKILPVINKAIDHNEPIHRIKACIPESFMQTRIAMLNYKTLANILIQRRNHRLPEWRAFCRSAKKTAKHRELLPQIPDKVERDL